MQEKRHALLSFSEKDNLLSKEKKERRACLSGPNLKTDSNFSAKNFWKKSMF